MTKKKHSSLSKVDRQEPKCINEKIARTGKDISFTNLFVPAFAPTGVLIWGFFSEFFSEKLTYHLAFQKFPLAYIIIEIFHTKFAIMISFYLQMHAILASNNALFSNRTVHTC